MYLFSRTLLVLSFASLLPLNAQQVETGGTSQAAQKAGKSKWLPLRLANDLQINASSGEIGPFNPEDGIMSGYAPDAEPLSTIFPDYYDGQLYIKLTDYPELGNRQSEKMDLREAAFISPEMISEFGIQSIEKTFFQARTNDFGIRNIYRIYFSKIERYQELIQRFERFPFVEYAELVPIHRKLYVPNDMGPNTQSGSGQWHLHRIQSSQAWNITTGSTQITVAIVDDAVKINHPDLQPNVWVNTGEIPNNGIDDDGNGYVDDVNGYDVSLNNPNPLPPTSAYSHGTHVAGCASQATDNGIGGVNNGVIGGAGIGFNVKLIAVKSTNSSSSISHGYPGVVYAADAGANVINMSWGGTGGGQTGQNIMNYANNKGCILVAASGNSNNTTTFFPAGFNHVISVSATQPNDTKASFSNYGSYVKISAPGTSIYSTYISGSGSTVNNSYSRIQGTSMASPIVAGLVGLMFSVNPNLTKQQVENCLYTTADPVAPGTGYNVNQMGAGRINAFQCLQCVAQTVNNPPISAISAQSGQNICPGGSITFVGGSTGGLPTSYQWTFPGGTPSTSTQQNPTVTYGALGTYDVTLTTTNSFGQSTVTSQNFVNVAPGAPTLIFREDFEDGSMQAGWTVNNPDNSNTWVLANTAGNISGTRSARMSFHNYSAVGQRDGLRTPPLDLTNYSNISMNFTHAYRRRQGGSTAPSDSLIVKISTDGGQSFTRVFTAAENGSGTFATGVTTTTAFTPQSAADWCFGGDVGASCFTIQFPMAGGNSNVIIEFEGYNNNQNHLYIDDVEIRGLCQAPPPGPVADFFVSKSSICAGETVQFTDNSPNASSWTWAFQGGAPATSTAQNPLVAYSTPGTYDVTLTVSGTSGTDQSVNPGLIIVNPAPLAAVTINNGVLTALPSGQQSYQWMMNGMPIPGENGETYTPTGDGNYSVIVISNEGCTATSPAFSFTLGIDGQLESFGLSIYPNPGSEFVNISLGKEVSGLFQISLHDQAGRQLWGRAMELGLGTPIYVGNLPNGVYHLRLVSPQGQLINGKVQVLR